ncbi:MAG: hypothetical protein NDI60_08670 [Elusimicrobiales bacterium]|nr:hypothetical protein [Elusimicrobiales bacterium]
MLVLDTLETLIDRPESLRAAERPAGLGRAGLLGYAAGTLGLFMFLRLQSAVPPGAISFLLVLLFVLAANFFFAGVIHLFMDLTGAAAGAGAARLFLAFGCSDFVLTLLVPVAFLHKANVFNGLLGFTLCAAVLIYSRVRLIRRLYPVSANKALLAVWLPYASVFTLFFLGLVYAVAWVVWLLV